MSDTAAGLLTIAALIGVLAIVYVPFGDYMARVYTTTPHWRVEKRAYRLIGVNPGAEQSPRAYTLSVLGFSFVSFLLLGAILLGQSLLPFDRGLPGMPKAMAFNTAISFVTNTNWQSYGGESTLGLAAQAGGLAVQNFLTATEWQIVEVLARRRGRLVRQGELLHEVWARPTTGRPTICGSTWRSCEENWRQTPVARNTSSPSPGSATASTRSRVFAAGFRAIIVE